MRIFPILPQFSYLSLLIFLSIFFVVTPFFGQGEYGRVFLDISIISLLVVSVYTCGYKPRYLGLALILAGPAIIRLIWPHFIVQEISLVANALFFAFVIYVLLTRLFKTKEITLDAIYAAIFIYILIGVFWGVVYTVLEQISPGSYHMPDGSEPIDVFSEWGQDLIYYSFVTMTTVGYGDITPISQPAKSFAIFEAMTGQIYLTVLVARLVGMHISTSRK